MASSIYQIVIIIVVLIVAWLIAERFSPDPLVTKIVQILIFLVALWVIFFKVLPMAGVNI